MNKQRRKAIEEIIERLDEQRLALENVMNLEQEAYDNLPVNIQLTERGEAINEYIDSLDRVIDNLDDVITDIQDIIDR